MKKPFVGWEPDTGEVLVNGVCEEADLLLQCLQGEVLEGAGSRFTHWVNAGVLTPYTEAQQAAKLAQPLGPWKWDNATMAWVAL